LSQEACEEKVKRLISALRSLYDRIGEKSKRIELPIPQLRGSVDISIERLKAAVDGLEEEIRKLDPKGRTLLCNWIDMTSILELSEGLLAAEWSEKAHSLSGLTQAFKSISKLADQMTSYGSALCCIPGLSIIGAFFQVIGDGTSTVCGLLGDALAEKELDEQLDDKLKKLKNQLEVKIDKGNREVKDDLFKSWKYLEANMANLDARIVKVKKQLEEAIVELEDELYKIKHQLEAKIDELDKRNEERIKALKDQLETKIDELKKQLEEELSELEDKLSAEINSLKRRLDDLTRKITGLEKEIDGLKKQLDDVKNELSRTETRLMTAMDALERRLRMNISAVSSSLKGLSDRLDSDLTDIRKRIQFLGREFENLKKLYEELKKLLGERSSEVSGSEG